MNRVDDGWILVSVSAAGFLGAARLGLRVDLDRPLVVLLGPNGSGKSTVLAAVEWALFGKIAVGADAEPLKGAGNEPFLAYLHRDCDEAVVSLRFERAGRELIWRRSRRRAKPRDDDVSCEIDGQSATPDAADILDLTEGVYRRAVAPAQAALRALVSADADARDLALDRLFGIERFRTLTKGLAAASRELDRSVGQLQSRLERLFADLEREVSRRFDRRAEARARALATGLEPRDLTETAVAAVAHSLAGELDVILDAELAEAADLGTAAASLTVAADVRWRAAGPVESKKRLEDLVTVLDRPRELWERAVVDVGKREDQFSTVLAEDGEEAALDRSLDEAHKVIAAATTALEQASERAAVLHNAQVWIAAQAASAAADCPVCERPVVLAELESLVQERLRALESDDGTLAGLHAALTDANERNRALLGARARVEHARAEMAAAAARESTCRETALAALATACETAVAAAADGLEGTVIARARELLDAEPGAADLSDRLRGLSAAADEALQAVGREIVNAQAASTTLRERVHRLVAVADFLRAQSELDDLDASLAGPELAAARQATQTTASWRETLLTVADVASAVSANEARRRTQAVTPRLAAWFERLSRHASLRSAAIDVETVKAGGSRNSYRIRAHSSAGWQASRGPALSGGYQTILAVAALCSLADDPESRSGLSLLALDEPTQSLDPQMTAQLGRALGEHLQVGRLIVTTTDEAFAAAIEKAAGASRARRIVFADWDAERGIVLDGGAT